MKTTIYKAFGLRFASSFAMPELLLAADQEGTPDVEIVEGDLHQAWKDYVPENDYYGYTEEQFLLYVPGIAIFSIRQGKQIIVSPLASADDKGIRLYLLGTCMGAILLQRETLPLHGSALVIDGKAYAFVGDSGAGKSTLASALLSKGFSLLTDDVIAISFAGPDGNTPIVIPAYPQQKLWKESIDLLGRDSKQYEIIYETKYAVPVASYFCPEPVPLAGIFELAKNDKEEVSIRKYIGLERLPLLHDHTFRNFLIPNFGKQQWHFSAISRISSRVNVYQLQRPSAGFTIPDLVDRILGTIDRVRTS